MSSIRRLYIYLVCAISLNALTWATITLARHLIASSDFVPTASIAFQIAVIIAALPIFLAHWLWAQRLATREVEERGSTIRYLYLFGMMTVFTIPFLTNAVELVELILQWLFTQYDDPVLSPILHNVICLLPLALLWLYHLYIARRGELPWRGERGSIRRLYVLAFSAVGVSMSSYAVIGIIRFTLLQIANMDVIVPSVNQLLDNFALLVIGLPLWLLFWRWAQRLFEQGEESERTSTLRKLYLYGLIFASVLTVVSNATLLLAGILHRLLGLSVDGDWRDLVPNILTMGVVWAYHAFILRTNADEHEEAEGQARVRRACLYLVASIGLLTLVGGIGGNISVLIRSLADAVFDEGLREQVAWFTAALIAGLPVWLIPWRKAQIAAVAVDGNDDRHSTIRKAYLYFFLFFATLAVLSGVIYILWELVSLLLGEPLNDDLAIALAHAIAFALLGSGVWLYHGSILRGDGQLSLHDQAQRLAELGVVVMDVAGLGAELHAALEKELPTGEFMLLPLADVTSERLAEAGLIVGGYEMVRSAEITTSPARKLLIPSRSQSVEWVGIEPYDREQTLAQTVRAVKQIVAGERLNTSAARQLVTIAAALLGGFILLCVLLILLASIIF